MRRSGLITLIGLAAKNAILIVEFAKVRVDRGEELIQSTLEAVTSAVAADHHDIPGIYFGRAATGTCNRCRRRGPQNHRLYRIGRDAGCLHAGHIYCAGAFCGDHTVILWKKTTGMAAGAS